MTPKRKKQSKFKEPETVIVTAYETLLQKTLTIEQGIHNTEIAARIVRESDWKRVISLAKKAKKP